MGYVDINKLTLDTVESAEKGLKSIDTLSNLIVEKGIAINNLRPVGKAKINCRRIDVVTEGGYTEGNSDIIVKKVESTRIIVHLTKRR